MNKSINLEEKVEIEKVLNEKEDKSEISLDENILNEIQDKMDNDESKDDISFDIIIGHKMKPSLFSKYWSHLNEVKCYRTETVLMFLNKLESELKNDPEFTGLINPGKKVWSDRMEEGGFLKKTKNYLQHYSVYYSLFNRIPLDKKIS